MKIIWSASPAEWLDSANVKQIMSIKSGRTPGPLSITRYDRLLSDHLQSTGRNTKTLNIFSTKINVKVDPPQIFLAARNSSSNTLSSQGRTYLKELAIYWLLNPVSIESLCVKCPFTIEVNWWTFVITILILKTMASTAALSLTMPGYSDGIIRQMGPLIRWTMLY